MMKRSHLFILIVTLFFASCSPKQKAKTTIRNFVKASVPVQTNYSFNDFGRLDSTRYVTDSIIVVMRKSAQKDTAFGNQLKYGNRTDKREYLKYIPVKMKIANRDTIYTFYLTNDLKQVVAFK